MIQDVMIRCALEAGFSAAAMADTKDILFEPSFRSYCEENLCGQYHANYSCPPTCGSPEEMKQKILAHKKALVLRTSWEISDYGDITAILKAKTAHNAAELQLTKKLMEQGYQGLLVGASGCALCSPCQLPSGLPCRFPDTRYSCMSAYCINVRQLVEGCGMDYSWKEGFLSFFSMFVWD